MLMPTSGQGASAGSRSMTVARREWLRAVASATLTMKGSSTAQPVADPLWARQLVRMDGEGWLALGAGVSLALTHAQVWVIAARQPRLLGCAALRLPRWAGGIGVGAEHATVAGLGSEHRPACDA